MNEKKIGLLLRSYASQRKDVLGVVDRAVESIKRASRLQKDGKPIFDQMVILVPSNYDCSITADAIRRELEMFQIPRVMILEAEGDHASDVLNVGTDLLLGYGIDHAVIASNKAINALTVENMSAIIRAFDKGAKAVGVAIYELQDIILQGRLQNTFCCWDIKALQAVGGFDSKIAVEEIAPIVRLIREYGPCIAVIVPSQMPSLAIRRSAEGIARYKAVTGTKTTRQTEELQRVDSTFEFVQSGIMPDYPLTV